MNATTISKNKDHLRFIKNSTNYTLAPSIIPNQAWQISCEILTEIMKTEIIIVKRTVGVISITLHLKCGMSDLQLNPLNIYLRNHKRI